MRLIIARVDQHHATIAETIEEMADEATDAMTEHHFAMIDVTIEERIETEIARIGVDRQESREVLEVAEMIVEGEIENATTETGVTGILDEGERAEAVIEAVEGKAGGIRARSHAIDLGQETGCAILARGTTGAEVPGGIETET